MRLVLVRHAMPEIDPTVPAHRRRLGADGRAAAWALGPLLPASAYLVASDEPKAAMTLADAARDAADVVVDADFGEVRRPDGWVSDHREWARAYVAACVPSAGARPADGVHDGWEVPAAVAARFEAAVARHAERAGRRTLVVGTHGMAMTVWLVTRVDLDPAGIWAALRFPDMIDVDLAAGAVSRRTP